MASKRKPKGKYASYVEPKLKLISNWARSGLIDKQIAKNLGIADSTFREYKKMYPALSAALKESKEEADYEVVNALFRSATGYEYDEETKELVKGRWKTTKKVTKHEKPNPTAAIFWLKNRDSKNWRDRQHINHSGGVVSKVVDYSYMSEEELEKELKRYEEK